MALRTRLELQRAADKRGKGLRILTETVTSPTLAAQIAKLLKEFPEAKWAQHDPISRENVRAGTERAFGKAMNVVYDFTKADVVLSLDADFLCSGPGHVRYSNDFASRRKVRIDSHDGGNAGKMNRLYVVESMPSNTGSIADHRLAIPSSLVESFARALAAELEVEGAPKAGDLPERVKAWIKPLADDLITQERRGKCVVVVGDHQPASLHALAHAINAKLENLGKTVLLSPWFEVRPAGKVIDLRQLADEMEKSQVETLLVLSSNPAYTRPADVAFTEEQLKKRRLQAPSRYAPRRDGRAVRLARPRSALPRNVGRHSRSRWHGHDPATAHRAALQWQVDRRVPGRCRSWRRIATGYDIVAQLLAQSIQRAEANRDVSRRCGKNRSGPASWPARPRNPKRRSSKDRSGPMGAPPAAPVPARPIWKSTSAPTRRSSTAASRTTAGSRNARSR